MKHLDIRLFLLGILLSIVLPANELIINQKSFEKETIFIVTNSFRILDFDKMIQKIQMTNSENLTAEFLENRKKPLTRIKIFARKASNESALITFYDGSSLQVNFNVVQDIKDIISLLNKKYPKMNVKQINDTIVLDGTIPTKEDKETVIDIFTKASIDVEKKLVDLLKVVKPTKMVRVKLYAVEVNNDKGLTIKNNWTLSRKNYMQVVDKDNLYQNEPLRSDSWGKVNNQRNSNLEDAMDNILKNAVTLSGGLTGAANYLGKLFNVGLTLNYLSSKGVANILDETTLIALEKDTSKFHAGGTIYLKTQTLNAQGLPITTIRDIDYGLQLEITAKNVIDEDYIHLNITTKSTQIDWTNKVDGIPSFFDKSIETTVIAKNNGTIVLGGLIKNTNSKDIDKIPLLGDIPILGMLFKSKSFKEGKSELVFFITPEIVDPMNNNQEMLLINQKKKMKSLKADGYEIKSESEEDINNDAKKKI